MNEEAVAALGPGDPTRLGSWQVVGRLGAGGMGTVYLGRQEGRTAAVKAIAPALADNPDFRARFRREIDICQRVSGAQVAELYDADPDAAQPWLAVRYVPGPTLDHAIRVHGPLTGPTLDGFALAVAEALRQIHAAGVTHRDLKPSNVILTAETPVLIDFGIAAAAEATSLTATGTSMGSAGWMAPEQILGNPTGAATDVFAWGALVAYASTGQPPFGVGRPESLSYRVVHGTPDLEHVPDRYRPLCARALSVDPAARPTVAQVLAELSGDPAATQVAQVIAATWVGDDATRLATTVAEDRGPRGGGNRGRGPRCVQPSMAG
jgi:serine/threonine protein kinase